MHFALQCVLAEGTDEQRVSLRTQHLQYIEANKHRILCGGPTLNADGQPEMMLIILDVPDQAAAEAFMQAEPYNRAGVFAKVTIREWRQILPEAHPGALLHAINQA
jgi:uncharacterized protein